MLSCLEQRARSRLTPRWSTTNQLLSRQPRGPLLSPGVWSGAQGLKSRARGIVHSGPKLRVSSWVNNARALRLATHVPSELALSSPHSHQPWTHIDVTLSCATGMQCNWQLAESCAR